MKAEYSWSKLNTMISKQNNLFLLSDPVRLSTTRTGLSRQGVVAACVVWRSATVPSLLPHPGCWLVVRLRVHSVQLHRPILKFWGQDLLVTLWLLHIHSCLFGLLRGLNEESWSLHCVFEYVWWGQKKTKASELGLNPQATTKSSQSSTRTSLGCATS